MRKTAYYTTLAVALVTIVGTIGCSRFKIKAEDEGPIIVKNGSMTIDTDGANAAWRDDGGAWSNETGKDHRGDLWVRVDLTDGTMCRPTNPDTRYKSIQHLRLPAHLQRGRQSGAHQSVPQGPTGSREQSTTAPRVR